MTPESSRPHQIIDQTQELYPIHGTEALQAVVEIAHRQVHVLQATVCDLGQLAIQPGLARKRRAQPQADRLDRAPATTGT